MVIGKRPGVVYGVRSGQDAVAVRLVVRHRWSAYPEQVKATQPFAGLVARPAFIVSCLTLFAIWIAVNTDLALTGHKPWDEPPFFWLQGVVSAFSLAITATVLVSQARQARLAEQRADLQLQVIFLIGQRSAKLIELTEELRRDLPNVHNRRDEQAEILQQVLTPDQILSALEGKGPEQT